MATIRSQILTAAFNALMASNVANGNIYRSREQAFSREELPAIVISPDTENSSEFADRVDKNLFTFQLDIYVRGEVWDDVADPIALQAIKVILSDPTVRGLCTKIRRDGTKWDGSNADATAGVQTERFKATYLADQFDPSVQV